MMKFLSKAQILRMSNIHVEEIPQLDSCFAGPSVKHTWVSGEETTWGTETRRSVPPPGSPEPSPVASAQGSHTDAHVTVGLALLGDFF